jgi:isoleucyl-tRNA synthetase
MPFKESASQVDFVAQEREVLGFWSETDAFNELRRLRADSPKRWSFLDGPITANNPMGVHHAWGRTYKDIFQRFKAMQGHNQRWQNGFDCQGLWVEVNVEKDLGFKSKRDIETHGLADFVKLCKMRVLQFAAVQTEQSIRLGYWMDWNSPEDLRRLRDALEADPRQGVTIQGAKGPVTGPAETVAGRLGMPEVGGSYFTFSDENNYQIWSFLKRCYDRGWVYKGRDVMPWCARCGTGISQHEIVTDGYQDLTHETVFLRFPLVRREKEALLVWTTTPWTLTSNVAAAVGPDLTYVRVKQPDGWTYVLAQGALKNTLKGEHEVVEELKGSDLVGLEYTGPFDELDAVKEAFGDSYRHQVVGWKDVGAEEGTGIVHIAPGCGAEDFGLSKEQRLPVVAPLDENGIYLAGFGRYTGARVSEVAPWVFESLKEKGLLYRSQRYTHRYPTCWRCGEELVFRLVDEWYISMGEQYDKPREEVTPEEKAASLRYQIMDVVDQARWIPSFGHDREMDWLRNMHDWMISKKRYWGLALPIWVCDDCGHFEVIGSDHELKDRATEGWETFEGHTPHRPYVDAVKIACAKCGGTASRVKEVGNPWLDAGIVAFSTMHFREDHDFWEKWFPADLITESFPGQFRNWFYSLLAQSTVLSGRAPFKNLLGYATLLAEDGREMHKSWGNAIEFNEAADKMGADVMRWLYAGHRPEQNLLFGYKLGDETRRRFFIPLWNVYSFFVNYARLDGWLPSTAPVEPSPNPANAQMDRWIVARLNEATQLVTEALEGFDTAKGVWTLEALLDDLSNWYVRRSRRRFWKSEADTDKTAAYATLYRVLVQMTRLLAPFAPFITEAMYQNLVRGLDASAPASVHHTDWPAVQESELDPRLVEKMGRVIIAAGLGRSARAASKLNLRQPLSKASVHVGTGQARQDVLELADVLAEELNVKQVEAVAEVGELVNYRLLPNSPVLGPRLGTLFPQVRKALEALNPAEAAATLQSGGTLDLTLGGESVSLNSDDVLVQTESRGGLAVASDRGITVALDTELTPNLIREGHARELVRLINSLRKDSGLALEDRIEVTYQATGSAEEALRELGDSIRRETLAVSLTSGAPLEGGFQQQSTVGDEPVTLSIRKA